MQLRRVDRVPFGAPKVDSSHSHRGGDSYVGSECSTYLEPYTCFTLNGGGLLGETKPLT